MGQTPFSVTIPVFLLFSSVPEPLAYSLVQVAFVLPWNNYIITHLSRNTITEVLIIYYNFVKSAGAKKCAHAGAKEGKRGKAGGVGFEPT